MQPAFYRVQEVRQKKREPLQKNTAVLQSFPEKTRNFTILKSSTTALRLQSIQLNCFKLRDQIVRSACALKQSDRIDLRVHARLVCNTTVARHRKCVAAFGSAMNFPVFYFPFLLKRHHQGPALLVQDVTWLVCSRGRKDKLSTRWAGLK